MAHINVPLAQIMYSEIMIEQNDIIIAYLKENTKLQQKMINCVADSEVEFEELSLNVDAPTRDFFHRCQQERNKISMKGTSKKKPFVMVHLGDVLKSKDDGDGNVDDATSETPVGSTNILRKDSGTVTPDAKTSLQASNVNMK
ncbi:hypothetical protein E3Q23_02417 [Wallemia mellicola]|uniref:Uncharacterized protein n=1 Tax=Wallemia mellicola TaxID=1708541 RepID=A0A4V6TSD7_9BASI|nr:hypothetical protein E3Q23_02417 [Wallemia mellicola]TIC64613.1 hypothetical protein E3Q01_02623 [Wallemia mellicola]